MRNFAYLFEQLHQTNKTKKKVAVLKEYFAKVEDSDKVWTIALFTARRPKRPINSTQLRTYAYEAAGLPQWLFEESYHVVGDLAETISLLLPFPEKRSDENLSWWLTTIIEMVDKSEEERKAELMEAWVKLDQQERFVFNKILTGAFRVGVSQNLVVQALSEFTGIEKPVIAHRIMGNWDPATIDFQTLLFEENHLDDLSRPYPFYLAYPLDAEAEKLGGPEEWEAEWKYDGIRAQVIKRGDNLFIWSRGEEMMTDKFPELKVLNEKLPEGTVLDGEILPYRDDTVLPFGVLQTRIGRKNLTSKILQDAPVGCFVYDLLEWEGRDFRSEPLSERRELARKVVEEIGIPCLNYSKAIDFNSWKELAEIRATSRENSAEGLMLKRKSSPYLTGRKRGDWWKWKLDPLSVDGVLIYAQKGHGRRADLYTDYTFAVWQDKETLVPFAKAYSGLTDEEIRKVDAYVKRNTVEKFGPVRSVEPELVFEIGFEGIQESTRHKCGIAVRFPRILRWRTDKKPVDADTLEALRDMLNVYKVG